VTDNHRLSGLSRRRVLLALGAAGLSGVAGCNSSSSDDPTSTETTAATETRIEATDTDTAATATDSSTATDTATPGVALGLESVTATPEPPRQFRPVEITATVENTGAAVFEGTVRLSSPSAIDDDSEATATASGEPTVSIAPGEAVTRTTTFRWAGVGSKSVSITAESDGERLLDAARSLSVERFPEHSIGVDGTDLTCDGEPIYFAGGAPTFTYDPNVVKRINIEVSFATLAEIGCTFARTWAYTPYWSETPAVTEPYTYDEDFFTHFDHVVAAAKKRGIRLSAALFNGNPAYGPMGPDRYGTNVPQFVAWADDAEEYNDFFDSEECMAMYQDWVETVLTHENHITGLEYRNDPTIAMWELGNEIQRAKPAVGETIRPWIEEAGSFVKEIDDETLLTTGSYGHQGRNAYVDEASADPIDVASIHYYPGPANYDLSPTEATSVLEETVQTTHEEIEKPLYIGEYNWGLDAEPPQQIEERNRQLERLHDVLDEHDVSATMLWHIVSWSRGDGQPKENTVFAGSDDETITELQRYIDLTRSKSAAECLPSPPSS